MELRRYLNIIWRWSWLLVLGTVLAGGAAYIASRSQTKLYTARATVLVNQAQGVAGPSYNDVLTSERLARTYANLIASRPVQEQVENNLNVDFDATDTSVSAGVRRDTQLIDVSVESRDPDLSAAVANEAAKVFAEKIAQDQLGVRVSAISELENQAVAAQRAVDDRQQEVNRLVARPPELTEEQRQRQLADAQIQLDTARQSLTDARQDLQEARLEIGRTINSVAIASPALPPDSPSSPRVGFNTLLGALVGLIVVAGIVALLEYLDDTVKSADEVERAAGLPTLGAIRRFDAGPNDKRSSHLILNLDNRSPVAEAYRMVRTNLEFARSGSPGNSMQVTSTNPGEGKSTSAANLAIVLAQTGKRVILVDADMRHPTVHKLFELPNTAGLSTLFVMEQPRLEGVLRVTPIESLLVLSCGPLPPNPAELLASARMGEILELLKHEADMVVIDSPPLLGVADASTLAARVDGVLLVVDAGRTRAGALHHAAEILRRANATVWGVMLNKLRARHDEGYYYYYGSYSYGSDSSNGAGHNGPTTAPVPGLTRQSRTKETP